MNLLPPRRLTIVLGVAIAILTGASIASNADEKWLRNDSTVRLQCAQSGYRDRGFCVEIPEGLDGFLDARAYMAGQLITARPIYTGNRMAAVEVMPPPRTSEDKIKWSSIVHIYLLKEPAKDNGIPYASLPISCSYAVETLVARPPTGQDFLNLSWKGKRTRFYRGTDRFCPPEYATRFRDISKKRRSHNRTILRFSSMLQTEEVQCWEFRIENEHSAPWYLFIDKQPVFSWGNIATTTGKDALPVSHPVSLSAGLHRIDLMTLLDIGEEVPQLRCRPAGSRDPFKEIPIETLYSPDPPDKVTVQFRGEKLDIDVTSFPMTGFVFSDELRVSNHRIGDIVPLDEEGGNSKVRYRFHGNPIPIDLRKRSLWTWSDDDTPVQIQTDDHQLAIHPEFDWFMAHSVSVKLHLPALPLFEPVDDSISLDYVLEYSKELKAPLFQQGKLILTHISQSETVGKQEYDLAQSPYERRVEFTRPAEQIDFSELVLEFAGRAIVDPIRIYWVSPDDPVVYAESGGKLLRYADGFAVLRRLRGKLDIPKLRPKPISRMAIIDDFIASQPHPLKNLKPAQFAWALGKIEVDHLPVAEKKLSATLPIYGKLVALRKAMAEKPDLLVLAVGTQDLRARIDLRDFKEQTAFLIRQALANDILPVLVSVPVNGEFTQNELRDFALALKEFGETYDLPVADLYSASMRNGGTESFWTLKQNPNIRTATPSASGRRWILEEIRKAIKAHLADK